MASALHLDFETYSEADLKKVGSAKYFEHPSTEILCMAVAMDAGKVCGWRKGQDPEELEILCRILQSGYSIWAWNVAFERHCVEALLPKVRVLDRQWRCSAAVAAYHTLPRALGDCARELRRPHQKDPKGWSLMAKLSWPNTKTGVRYHGTDEELDAYLDYCKQDVETERDIHRVLPPLPKYEQEVWALDQKINRRGIRVDSALVQGGIKVNEASLKVMTKALRKITDFDARAKRGVGSFKQSKRLAEWMQMNGVQPPKDKSKISGITTGSKKLQAMTIDNPIVKRAVDIYCAGNKSSIDKYKAVAAGTMTDGRVRGSLLYHGASTGRWSGKGIQPHNLPRSAPKPKEMERLCRLVAGGSYDAVWQGTETVKDKDVPITRMGVPSLLSRISRGLIVPAPGCEFFDADYSAIEARGTAWICGHEDMLNQFRAIDGGECPGEDIYTMTASRLFGRKVTTADDEDRQSGKVTVLGCGYGMGHRKLVVYAKDVCRMTITEEASKDLVTRWRKANKPIVNGWYELERAAIRAVQNGPGGAAVEALGGRVRYQRLGAFLYCRLPAKRCLSYFLPKLDIALNEDGTPRKDRYTGEEQLKLTYSGYIKPGVWGRCSTYGGKLMENNVQALCRDLLVDGMVRAEAAGYPIILHVHDEMLAEVEKGKGDLDEFLKLLSQPPSWAPDFPVKAGGWKGERYGKA